MYIYDNISLISSQNNNVSDRSCRENQNTYFKFNNFFSENRAVYEVMWKKCGTALQVTDGNIVRRMRIAFWKLKADSHIACRAHAAHMPSPCHAVTLRVQNVSFPFDLHSAAVSDSQFPCRAHAVFLKATAQHGRRQTACGLPARLRILLATTRSSTKIVIRSIPILLTTIHTYDCKEWQRHTTRKTIY